MFVKIGRDGNYDNSAAHYDIVGSSGNSGIHIFEVQGSEKLRITKDGNVSISGDGSVHGVSKLTLLPANRTTAFSASDGDTWHDIVLKQTGDAATNAVGIAFEISASAYHKNAGTGIACVKNGIDSDYGSDLVFVTRPQSAVAAERLRIKSNGNIVLGSDGTNSELTFSQDGTSGVILNSTTTGFGGYNTFTVNSAQFIHKYGGNERLRIGSEGNLALGGTNTSAYANQSHFFIGGMGNLYADTPANSGSSLSLTNNSYINTSGNWVYRTGGKATNIFQYDGDIGFRTIGTGSAGNTITWSEKLRIKNDGIIQCGTSGTLQALINNSVNGHQFISQCSDNNNGFEVYQKHGSSTTRNTFAVYANTGSGGAKRNQLSVRGDGLVTVDGDFDFNKFVPDGTITTTLSSNSSSGNYTTIIPLNTSGIGHAQTYLVSIFWNYNSSGSAPYYCAGAVLWGTPHSNSGSGVNYPFEMLSSAHVTGNYYLKIRNITGSSSYPGLQAANIGWTAISGIRNITGSSSYPGLQAANIGWTAISGSQYIVKYKRMY